MKVLVVVSCFLAAASAGFLGAAPYAAPYAAAPAVAYAAPAPIYAGPQHLPVIGPNGVPLEEPANVAARAAHAHAHVEAKARNGDLAVVGPAVAAYAAPGFAAGPAVAYAAPAPIYAGPQHLPVIGPNGVPLEPPANVAARAAHAHAHVEAKARNGDLAVVGPAVAAYAADPAVAYAAPAPIYAGPQHLPVIGPNGVPLESPVNVAARAAHAAAHVEAKVRNGDLAVLGRKKRGIFAGVHAAPAVAAYAAAPAVAYAAPAPVYAGPQHLPVIGANGVPLDTPEVVAARAQHAVAKAVAQTGEFVGSAVHAYGAAPAIASYAAAPAIASYAAAPAVAYAAPAPIYAGPQHLPVIGPNGVPLEPPANVAARAAHAHAHVEAKARNGDLAVVGPAVAAYGAPAIAAYGAPAVAAYAAPAGIVTHAGGVPLDTPEVAAAKAAHFQAHINVKAAHGLI